MTRSDLTSQVGVLSLSSNSAVSRQRYSKCDVKKLVQYHDVTSEDECQVMTSIQVNEGKIEVGYGVQSLQTISVL